jgi:tripartite-type tricarboxylate transporter receptor subunit TctC
VMGGQVPLFFANLASSIGHLKSGRLRALAVTSFHRTRALPEIPTMHESGVRGHEVLEWNPVLAPAGLPAEVKSRLIAAIRRAMDDPEVLGRVRALGGEVFPLAQAGRTEAFLKEQQILWARVVRERAITLG